MESVRDALRMDGRMLTQDIERLKDLESLELPTDWIPDSVLQH